MAKKIPPFQEIERYVKETVRELLSLPFFLIASTSYEVARKLAPEEKITDPEEEDDAWETESPGVTQYRHELDRAADRARGPEVAPPRPLSPEEAHDAVEAAPGTDAWASYQGFHRQKNNN